MEALGQFPVPVTVYLITEVPAVNAVTWPEVGSIVATAVFDELHVPPDIVEVNILLSPAQNDKFPTIAPALGGFVTVTGLENITAGHPPAEGKV